MSEPIRHAEVSIDLREISDWLSFHTIFKQKMGFPDFYGMNMDAWIDCMSCVDVPEDGMSSIHAPSSGVLVLALHSVADFKKRCPEIFEALVDCAAFVNYRRLEAGTPPVLSLSYFE
jgi:hypothetical protein